MFRKFIFPIVMVFSLSGCDFLTRLNNLGRVPPMHSPEIPTAAPEVVFDDSIRGANSLWQPGSSRFFKGKSRSVGDIVRVNVEISDKAKLENESNRQRKSKEGLSLPKLFGLNKPIIDVFSDPNAKNPSGLLDIESANSSSGKGAIDRSEKIKVQVAAVVIRALPNGGLLIEGSQEIRVNYEIRAVSIQGMIRSEDISVDNTIDASKIAELRVSYGGRGHLSDFQQPRYGAQLIDMISPF